MLDQKKIQVAGDKRSTGLYKKKTSRLLPQEKRKKKETSRLLPPAPMSPTSSHTTTSASPPPPPPPRPTPTAARWAPPNPPPRPPRVRVPRPRSCGRHRGAHPRPRLPQGRVQVLAPAIAAPLRRCLTTERIRLDLLCKFPTAARPLHPRARRRS